MPELHFAIAMGLAALCCGEEALVVAQDMPWAPLGDWLQRFDGIGELAITHRRRMQDIHAKMPAPTI